MVTNMESQYFSFDDLCSITELSSETLVKIVEHGVVEPEGTAPESWMFTTHMVTVTKKAVRLHRDLEIDWSGIALAISLLEELEDLKKENEELQRRLGRFIGG